MSNIYYVQGNQEEAFYQLGLGELHSESPSRKISSIILGNGQISNFISKKIMGSSFKMPDFLQECYNAYIEGKKISKEAFIHNFYLADIISVLNSKVPLGVPSVSCSSVVYNLDNELHHLRILDYPLGHGNKKFEKDLFFNLSPYNKVFSKSYVDLPFPGLTASNDQGFSFALHQRVSDSFNRKGQSIFELMSMLSLQAKSLDDIKKIAIEFSPITNWGLIIVSNKDKKALEIEVTPNDVPKIIETSFPKEKVHYINNHSLFSPKLNDDNNKEKNYWDYFCHSRDKWFQEKKFKATKNIFKNITSIDEKSSELFQCITPASIQAIDINLTSNKWKSNNRDGVKHFSGDYTTYEINFEKNHIVKKLKKDTTPKVNQTSLFYNSIIKCQEAFDQGLKNELFHSAQNCIQHAPNDSMKAISTIFYSLYSLMEIKNNTILNSVFLDLLKVEHSVPQSSKQDFYIIAELFHYYLDSKLSLNFAPSTSSKKVIKQLKNVPRKIFQPAIKKILLPRYETFSIGKATHFIDAVTSP